MTDQVNSLRLVGGPALGNAGGFRGKTDQPSGQRYVTESDRYLGLISTPRGLLYLAPIRFALPFVKTPTNPGIIISVVADPVEIY
jgi:hypothetical protein